MKKLIIAVCAIAMAVVANAADVKWSISGAYERGSTSVKAGSGYTGYFVSASDYTLAAATADLAKGDMSFLSTYGVAPSAFKMSTATPPAGTGTAGATITTTAGNNEPWTGYVVIVDSTELSKASYAYITTELTKSTGATGGQATLSWASSAMTGTKTASNWYAVPEPTSGLLLLLGMAGLALRRRRA